MERQQDLFQRPVRIGKQAQALLNYLQKFQGITSTVALRELGIARLAARVYDLRRAGYNVEKTMISVDSRYDERGRTLVAWYKLGK